jgi:hypothetical protein
VCAERDTANIYIHTHTHIHTHTYMCVQNGTQCENPKCELSLSWEGILRLEKVGKVFSGGLGNGATIGKDGEFRLWVCVRDWDWAEMRYVCMYVYTYVHTYYVLIKPPIPYSTSSPLCLLRVFTSYLKFGS